MKNLTRNNFTIDYVTMVTAAKLIDFSFIVLFAHSKIFHSLRVAGTFDFIPIANNND